MSKKRHDFDDTGTTLHFEFGSEEAARHFKTWLCEKGEQSYWSWMEYREFEMEDDDEPITVLEFDYWQPDGRIPTRLGSLRKGNNDD